VDYDWLPVLAVLSLKEFFDKISNLESPNPGKIVISAEILKN